MREQKDCCLGSAGGSIDGRIRVSLRGLGERVQVLVHETRSRVDLLFSSLLRPELWSEVNALHVMHRGSCDC